MTCQALAGQSARQEHPHVFFFRVPPQHLEDPTFFDLSDYQIVKTRDLPSIRESFGLLRLKMQLKDLASIEMPPTVHTFRPLAI